MLSIEHGKTGQLVTKQNNLIKSSYRLTLQEQRLLYVMISMINKEDDDFQDYIVDLKEFSKIVGYKGKSFYSEAIKITKKLESRVLEIENIEKGSLLQISWISSAEYIKEKGYVKICFDPKLKPYLLQIKGSYTQFTLLNILKLRSAYAVRIYELLKQYEGFQKERKFPLEDLKRMLGLGENEYKLFGDFKRYVLEKSKKEINQKTDLHIDYRTVKLGRKVEGIVFLINQKSNNKELPIIEEIKNKKLYNKLINKFQQSPKQSREYLEKFTENQIEQNLKIIEYKYKNGKISNLGAYTHKAITENYYGQTSLFESDVYKGILAEKKRKKEAEKREEEKKEAEKLEHLKEIYESYRFKEAEKQKKKLSEEEFKKLEETVIKEVEKEYGTTNPARGKMAEITIRTKLFEFSDGITFEEWCEKQ